MPGRLAELWEVQVGDSPMKHAPQGLAQGKCWDMAAMWPQSEPETLFQTGGSQLSSRPPAFMHPLGNLRLVLECVGEKTSFPDSLLSLQREHFEKGLSPDGRSSFTRERTGLSPKKLTLHPTCRH